MSAALRPTAEEISGMIVTLCRRKRWTRTFLSALLRIPSVDLDRYESCAKRPPDCVTLLIWLFFTLDCEPEKARDIFHIATWGQSERRLPPRPPHKTTEEIKAIVEELRACAAGGYKTKLFDHPTVNKRPGRIPIRMMADHYRVRYERMTVLARQAGYKCPRNVIRHSVPTSIRKSSKWMAVDWRKPEQEIADYLGVPLKVVVRNRRRLRGMPKMTLRKHLLSIGVDTNRFAPILAILPYAPKGPPWRWVITNCTVDRYNKARYKSVLNAPDSEAPEDTAPLPEYSSNGDQVPDR